MKINKIKMLISSILIIIPTLISVLFSKQLDGMIAVHWGLDGNADYFTSPIVFITVFPLFLIAIQWLCVLVTIKTNDKNNQSKKITEIIYWICPVLSIYVSVMMFSVSVGYDINIFTLSCILFGLMFIVIGNYMPKCTRNRTLGIKIKWTLTNEENWNKTHRFAGKAWFSGGLILLVCAFLPLKICITVFLIILFAMILLPIAYSYLNYRTQIKEGRATKEDFQLPPKTKFASAITAVTITLLLIATAILMFTGEVDVTCTDNAIIVDSTFSAEISIDTESIKDISYKDDFEAFRISGFGSARLSVGLFKSEELGNVTCYCYAQNKNAVIIETKNNGLIVINQENDDLTKNLYNEILQILGKEQ